MKAVFVGGGALRHLGTLRAALAEQAIFAGGEICLYDLNGARAEAMGRMVLKTPEYARVGCKVTWGQSLDASLEGADAVSVVLLGGSRQSHWVSEAECRRHGFIGSDNLSPAGTVLALKTAPILTDLAARMRRHCPDAWLMEFANPVPILSSLVNNHGGIKALGICAGYTNHQWDLSRILGSDEQCRDVEVLVAGVNHLSFILHGTLRGEDLFALLDRRLKRPWKMPRLGAWWSAAMKRNIRQAVAGLLKVYRELGPLVFSTEGDGMAHLLGKAWQPRKGTGESELSPAQIRRSAKLEMQSRANTDACFRDLLTAELDERFWREHWKKDAVFKPEDDIFVEVLRGIAGVRPARIATSRPNAGAVPGIADRAVLEYSQILERAVIRPAANLDLPGVTRGLVDCWATHQTMVADAIAAEDPRMLARALRASPVRMYSSDLEEVFRSLLKLNAPELPRFAREAASYL